MVRDGMGLNFISITYYIVLVDYGWSDQLVKKWTWPFQTCFRCLRSIISPHTKFHPNRTTNAQVRNFHFWSILVGRAGRSKIGRRHFKLILCCFCPTISPYTKFHPNRTKNTEVENFHYWSILVGRAGWSKNGRSHFKHSIAVWKVINDLCTKFEPNRMKIGRVSPF